MKSINFKPKTVLEPKQFPNDGTNWVIGLDIGYSAVKGICPNKIFSFPSYARRIPADRDRMKGYADTDIRYRDKDGIWAVGTLAYDEVVASEVIDSEEELF